MYLSKTGRSIFFAVAIIIATLLAPAVSASGDDYYFEPNSDCGSFVPDDVELKLRTHDDRYQVYLEFEITEAQIDKIDCAGSHFNLEFHFTGFDPWNDWSGCAVDYSHQYTFGADVVDGGDGTAIATVYGAKIAENRLNPGDVFWAKVDCPDLWPDSSDTPSVGVEYVGTWWSTDVGAPGCEPTRFETAGTKGPAGLPVCVYEGPSAPLIDWDGEDDFPFQRGRGV